MPTKIHPSTRRTTDIKMPKTSDGNIDWSFSTPQFTKKDGTRDKRTRIIKSNNNEQVDIIKLGIIFIAFLVLYNSLF